MQLEASHIRTEQGRSITVAGTLADKDGISAVHLSCPTIHLDKTIDLIAIYGEPQTTYQLNYTHPINENVSSDPHNLVVTVTDVGGRQTSQEVLVTMDADFVAPQFTARPSFGGTIDILRRVHHPVYHVLAPIIEASQPCLHALGAILHANAERLCLLRLQVLVAFQRRRLDRKSTRLNSSHQD